MLDIEEFIKEPSFRIEFYDEDCSITENATEKTCAKTILNEDTGITRYYVKLYRGVLVNPKTNPINRMREIDIKWRSIQADVFSTYLMFLDTKMESYFRQAERKVR